MKSSRFVIAAASLALLVNAVVLGNVLYNRSAEPDSQLRLSERELTTSYSAFDRKENSGLALRLNWQRPESDQRYDPKPFTAEQLKAVGIETQSGTLASKAQPEREVLLVLELDGPAYRARLQSLQTKRDNAANALSAAQDDKRLQTALKDAESALRNGRDNASRLYVVDIGLDRDTLRQRYPNRNRYAVTQGALRSWRSNDGLHWSIARVAPAEVSVPYRWRQQLSTLLSQKTPRYELQVSFGQRLEPWVSDAFLP